MRRAKAKTPSRIPPPAEFIDRLTIEDPQGDTVGFIPFALWPAQATVLNTFQSGRHVIVLKARQLGISWLACAYALWLCVRHPVKNVLIFSKGLDEAVELVRRIAGMYNRIPNRADLPTMTGNTQELAFSNGSRIKAQPATKTAGSSFTASLVIADEFAKMMWADDLYTSMKPTVDGGGQLIIISSANGGSNLFSKLWRKAESGENGFVPVFLPWWSRPDRTAEWYAQVSRESISQTLLDQEYPAKAEDAFNATNAEKFIPSMAWWDACRENLPALTRREPMVVGLDAALTGDSFALMAVTRHPSRRDDAVAVRHVQEWKPPHGGEIDYASVEGVLNALIDSWAVVELCYDPYQLAYLAQRLRTQGRVMVTEFNQGGMRLESDKMLLDLITQRRIAHDGNAELRQHVDNADKKIDGESRRLRIVKREQSLKIDLTVALSMAAYRCLMLPL
jgi:phage terminase large subunit-like protein